MKATILNNSKNFLMGCAVSVSLASCQSASKEGFTLEQQGDTLTLVHITNPAKYLLLPVEEHTGEEIEAKPEVKIKKPKPASLEEEQKKLLSQIIDEVNALYDKDYEPDFTTKAAMQIRDLLLKNAEFKERLKKSAQNNTLNEFKFTYDDCVQDALVEGYDQNMDFYTLLLNNEEIRAKFANVFMSEVYRILREEKDD